MSDDQIDLLKIIKGQPRAFAGCHKNVEVHLLRLRREFAGKAEASYQLARQIVYLRRRLGAEQSWVRFVQLIDEHIDLYAETLNTRWLVSICDTYADHGTPDERSKALLISTVANMVKLAETVRLVGVNSELDVFKVQNQESLPLWDGMGTYSIKHGDMLKNLFTRINLVFRDAEPLDKIWAAIYGRLKEQDTILRRLHKLHEGEGIFP